MENKKENAQIEIANGNMSKKKSHFNKKLPLWQKSFNSCMCRLSSGNLKRHMSQNYNRTTLFFRILQVT